MTTTWERGAVTASMLRAAPGVGVAQAPLEWPPVAAAAAVGPRLALPLLRGAMGLLGVVPPRGPLRGRPMVETPRGPMGVIGISLTDTGRAIPPPQWVLAGPRRAVRAPALLFPAPLPAPPVGMGCVKVTPLVAPRGVREVGLPVLPPLLLLVSVGPTVVSWLSWLGRLLLLLAAPRLLPAVVPRMLLAAVPRLLLVSPPMDRVVGALGLRVSPRAGMGAALCRAGRLAPKADPLPRPPAPLLLRVVICLLPDANWG